MNEAQLFERFREFTAISLHWCVEEAEKGTTLVTNAIDSLLNDLGRVSQMSVESLRALENLKSMLLKFDKNNYDQLQKSLAILSKENAEVDSYIQPIREALQYQDRFQQNLENALKMIDIWRKQREEIIQGVSGPDQLLSFGKLLASATTMKRERDVIRKHIPGMANELEQVRVEMF